MWALVYTAEAVNQIERLDARVRRQVESVLERLARGDRRGKPLRGELRGILSERVGNHRILYLEKRGQLIILILAIVHRRLAYGGH